jgi:hypothetical protein
MAEPVLKDYLLFHTLSPNTERLPVVSDQSEQQFLFFINFRNISTLVTSSPDAPCADKLASNQVYPDDGRVWQTQRPRASAALHVFNARATGTEIRPEP